ncbi:MAG: DUF4956 domain-containing protein [Bacteroidota bacterium]|jgi:hypothetical protein
MNLLNILLQQDFTEGTQAIIKTLSKFSWRLIIDLLSVFVLVRFVYFPIYKHRELFFTFFIFNLIIFLICFLLNKVELSMGAAFGLFAVFSMLRYRTEDISIKDMTYLFLVIAMGLIAAVTKIKDTNDLYEYIFLAIVNAIIIVITYLLESNLLMKKEFVKIINYENINLVQSNREAELIADISARTGINVHRISIQKIDFLRDAAQIKIYYYEN